MSSVARHWAVRLLFLSTVEAAHQMSSPHSDHGFGGYEEWSDTEIIILLSLAFACVVVFLVVGLALNRRTRQQRQRQPRKVVTAADVEQHFPVCRTEEEPTCAVCLSTIEVDELCRRTQCGHEFHADCIMQWWTHKPRKVLRCPICRRRQHVKKEQNGALASDCDCLKLQMELPPAGLGPAELPEAQEEASQARELEAPGQAEEQSGVQLEESSSGAEELTPSSAWLCPGLGACAGQQPEQPEEERAAEELREGGEGPLVLPRPAEATLQSPRHQAAPASNSPESSRSQQREAGTMVEEECCGMQAEI